MTTGDKAELLPCPFCGPTPAKPEVWRDHHGYVRVIHGPCGSSTGTRPKSDPDGESKVIAVWNTRAQAAGVSGVPEGKAIVPINPTMRMLAASQAAWVRDNLKRTTTLWAAMIEEAEREQREKALDELAAESQRLGLYDIQRPK